MESAQRRRFPSLPRGCFFMLCPSFNPLPRWCFGFLPLASIACFCSCALPLHDSLSSNPNNASSSSLSDPSSIYCCYKGNFFTALNSATRRHGDTPCFRCFPTRNKLLDTFFALLYFCSNGCYPGLTQSPMLAVSRWSSLPRPH
jgi:hypothetical protein